MARLTDHIRIIKHKAVPMCGSFVATEPQLDLVHIAERPAAAAGATENSQSLLLL